MSPLNRVVAVCFPRSGSYLVTYCMSRYFGGELKYLEPYANSSTFPLPRFSSRFLGARYLNSAFFSNREKDKKISNSQTYSFAEANFIRFHDFSSFPKRAIYMSEDGVDVEKKYCLDNVKDQDKTRYLILVRHPIETIQSYYELLVRRAGLSDSQKSWNSFQEHALEYWKAFADKWILNPNDPLIKNKMVVRYEDIIENTVASLSRIVSCFNYKELNRREVEKVAKLCYSSTRHISDFRYFSAKGCKKIQDQLHDIYLRPMGITPYINFSKSPSRYYNKLVSKLADKIIR